MRRAAWWRFATARLTITRSCATGWPDRGRPVRQATDVAVIPGMYLELGEAFVSKLTGAFAIAVWDPRKRRLMLARDRAGERPLVFHPDG